MKPTIPNQVLAGIIKWSCFECANKYKERESYSGTYTTHKGTCDICKQQTTITSAKKLFGHHNFI